MDIIKIFENFAADFEVTVADDDWSRLEKYLADDATYLSVEDPDSICKGRDAIIAYLKEDVTNFDRRFDTRTLVALTSPIVERNRLSRKWRCTYTLTGAPDLVAEGEARYRFEDNLIKEIEEQATTDSMQKFEQWMQDYGDRLRV